VAFNGSGVFQRVRNWVADATAGIKIRADYHDSEDDNFAAGISNCIAKDGQTTITQNIPFNAKRITGLADPINPQDAATKAYADTKLSGSGGVMTGDIVVTKSQPSIILNDTATPVQGNEITGMHAGLTRWEMRLGNGVAETGGNAGSNFDLSRFADDGTFWGTSLQFIRATGLGYVAGNPIDPLGIATKGYADTKVAKTGDTMTGALWSADSGAITQTGAATSFVVNSTSGHAAMAFIVPGIYGVNFGLSASDGNFYMGGVALGTGSFQFWTARDFANPAVVLAELRARIEALESRLP